MNNLKQWGLGVLTAFLVGTIVLGALALSLTESVSLAAGLPEQRMDLGQAILPTLGPFLVDQIPTISLVGASEAAELSSAIGDFRSPAPACNGPSGWALYFVMPDDTPASIAQRFGISLEEFAKSNCLDVKISRLPSGTTVFVPYSLPIAGSAQLQQAQPGRIVAIPTILPSEPKTRCGPPSWWSPYIVRWGDTLSALSAASGVSVAQLRQANCFGDGKILRAGQAIYLPVLPAIAVAQPQAHKPIKTPLPPTPTPTYYPTLPSTPPQPTAPPLPTIEPGVVPSIVPTVEPTGEPMPTIEPTAEPTIEPTVEPTVEPTIEPTIEPTVEPTIEPTVEPPIEPTVQPTTEPVEEPTQAPVLPTDPPQAPAQPADDSAAPPASSQPGEEPAPGLITPGAVPAANESSSLEESSQLPAGVFIAWDDLLGIIWPGRWLNSLPYLRAIYLNPHWTG